MAGLFSFCKQTITTCTLPLPRHETLPAAVPAGPFGLCRRAGTIHQRRAEHRLPRLQNLRLHGCDGPQRHHLSGARHRRRNPQAGHWPGDEPPGLPAVGHARFVGEHRCGDPKQGANARNHFARCPPLHWAAQLPLAERRRGGGPLRGGHRHRGNCRCSPPGAYLAGSRKEHPHPRCGQAHQAH